MAQRNVSVEIPIESPDDMETLTDAALTRHAVLGAGSPLTGEVDMVLLATKHGITVAKRAQGNAAQANSEADMLEANTAMGTAPGQNVDTAGTVYHLTAMIRDRLLFVHADLEEELEKYGFNVVISNAGGIKNVSVEIPIFEYQKMEKLAKNILDRHAALGAGSPLTGQVDMTLYSTQLATAKTKRKSSQQQHGSAQPLMQAADTALGTEAGQTSKTKGTVYNLITRVRDRLLFVHNGSEEELSTYGFNVVITEGRDNSVPPTGTFTANPTAITAGQSSTLTRNISGSVSQSIEPGIGEVTPVGTTQVTPAVTTTYTLKAIAEDESTLTITAPVSVGDVQPPPAP
ncbi:MAG: hypothetical protein HY841_15075 [Bacteroidetes bacterium]|nr:hypothetical protein [Bacteroidota bacterium]